MEIGEKLQHLRLENDIFQKEVASYLKVSIATISNYEQGIHRPDLETLCQLADFFHVTTDYLLDRTPCKHDSDALNTTLVKDFTIADMIDTTLSLSTEGQGDLVKYLKLLHYYNINESINTSKTNSKHKSKARKKE
ncbi:helix-turn-helix domain-containing protein [Lachnospiraceae bacterium OttesenSCG-928-D06]|nr:helix-turn-helix domain-containing protein [Lachnospiraceae bacterium OttesenSCG-928-D06]